MRILIAILLGVLLLLQFRLWFGDGGISEISALRDRVSTQAAENELLGDRNSALLAEVEDLRERLDAVEERARSELGLIRQGEQFIQVVPGDQVTGRVSNADPGVQRSEPPAAPRTEPGPGTPTDPDPDTDPDSAPDRGNEP